jgi:hypothetical protein
VAISNQPLPLGDDPVPVFSTIWAICARSPANFATITSEKAGAIYAGGTVQNWARAIRMQ